MFCGTAFRFYGVQLNAFGIDRFLAEEKQPTEVSAQIAQAARGITLTLAVIHDCMHGRHRV